MKPTEDYIESIILEETKKYLEEIRALDPELYKQVLQKIGAGAKGAYEKGYIPFTEPHRAADRLAQAKSSEWEVYIMVMGGPHGREAPLQDWPSDPNDRKIVEQFLTQLHGYQEGEVLDQEGNPLVPWREIQKLVMKEMDKFRQQQMSEVIKEEVVKYLKENE